MKHKRFTRLNPVRNMLRNLGGFKLCIVLLLGLGLTGIQAQEAILTAGGDATGSGGSVSYSIGQVVYKTIIGSNGYVAQGVQHFEISGTTTIDEAKGISLTVKAFPNPVSNNLILTFDASTVLSNQSINYQLFDIHGKLLRSEKVPGDQTNIDMSQLIPSTYFLKVCEGTRELKTFKVIKN